MAWSGHLPLVNAPSREALFDALRLIAEKRRIGFFYKEIDSTEDRGITAQVNNLGAEDGSGNRWIGTGFTEDRAIKFYVDTRTRTGWIRFKIK